MITARDVTDADWAAASAWWNTAWATPRSTAPPRQRDYTFAFVNSEQDLIGLGGLVQSDALPPSTRQLRLAMNPANTTQWEVMGCASVAVLAAFKDLSVAEVSGWIRRDADHPEVIVLWRWLVDYVVREYPEVIAAGGWWHEMPPNETDPDKSPLLSWHWVRRRPPKES